MEFQPFMSYAIIGLIWITIAVILFLLYFLFPSEIYYWHKVYDKCNATTAGHQYIIRFIFGAFKPTFQLSKTLITIDVWDDKQVLVALQIPSKQLVAHLPNCPYPPLKTVRFILYRKEPLLNIKHVVINHNGNGSINVTTIEIQNFNDKEANIAYIGGPVIALNKSRANTTQRFPAATREMRSIEQGLKPTLSLTATEFVFYIFLVINLMFLLTVYLIPCTQKTFCDDYDEGFLSSVFSGLSSCTIAAIVLVLCCCFHRYVIKKYLFKGMKICSLIRIAVILLVIVLGTICGIFGAVMAAQNRKFPKKNENQKFFHEVFWIIGFGIAIVVFFMFWLSMLSVIAYLIGFFSEPEEIKVEVKPELIADATVRTNEPTDGNDYMNQLIKENTKVKSISQYGGLSPKQKQEASKSAKSAKSATTKSKSVKRHDSVESTGSGYYKQLMKGQKKVKSVSQY